MFKLYRLVKQITSSSLASLGFPPHACRYTPSCSHYCEQAVKKYGFMRGFLLCLTRILRCHPWSKGGYDPV